MIIVSPNWITCHHLSLSLLDIILLEIPELDVIQCLHKWLTLIEERDVKYAR